MALSENRFQSTENQLKSIDGQNRRLEMLTAQVETLKGQNQAMQADGQRVLSAFQSENEQLRRQVSERQAAAAPRSEERRGGKGCVGACRSRWWRDSEKKK